MKVSTDIRRRDLIYFNLTLLPRLKSTYITIVVLAFGICAFLLWQNGSPETAHNWIVMIVSSIGGGIGGMIIGTMISVIFILATSSKSNGILGAHEYEITSEGILERTEANEGLNKWSGVQEVRKVGTFLLIKISGYLYHVIPKRSFESEEAFSEFMEKARNLWRGAA